MTKPLELPKELERARLSSKDVQGINVALCEFGVGVRLRRAGGWNLTYAERLARNTSPYRLAYLAEELTSETAGRILAKTYAETIVIHWWVLEDWEEKVWLPICTQEAVEEWLLEHTEEFLRIQEVAAEETYYLRDTEPGTVHEPLEEGDSNGDTAAGA